MGSESHSNHRSEERSPLGQPGAFDFRHDAFACVAPVTTAVSSHTFLSPFSSATLIGQRRARHAGGVTFVVTFWSAATVWLASTRTVTISLLRTFSHVCALDDVTPPDVTPPDGKDFALGAVALAVPALTVMPPPECASCSVDCQYMRCA